MAQCIHLNQGQSHVFNVFSFNFYANDVSIYDPAVRGGGRGRSRRCRALGPRGLTPLSLRQFYDGGGRDYVDYLMRHIENDAAGDT